MQCMGPGLKKKATFGATPSLLAHVQVVGFPGFFTEQFNTSHHFTLPRVDAAIAVLPPDSGRLQLDVSGSMGGERRRPRADQLRQRVAFALSEIFVASSLGNDITNYPDGLDTYWDLLARDDFGNFRPLTPEDVTLNPMMGDYLDMVHNDKPHPENNTHPNENYAREVMQLFTIGLYKLTERGSSMTKTNQSLTYDQDVLRRRIRACFHRLVLGTDRHTALEVILSLTIASRCARSHARCKASPRRRGVAGRTVPEPGPAKTLQSSNVRPFVRRELIQRLVTCTRAWLALHVLLPLFANTAATRPT